MCGNLKVVGLVGALGSGKSTAAAALETQGFIRMTMGGPLKDMMRVLGASEMDVNGPPAHRAQPSETLCGKSWRYAMQTIGTDWGRDLIGRDLWANIVQARIVAHQTSCALQPAASCRGIVIEDVRFPNEMAMVRRLGGQLWRIRRPEVEVKPSWLDRALRSCPIRRSIARAAMMFGWKPLHESELHWWSAEVDAEFWNTADADALAGQVYQLLDRLAPSNT